MFVKGSPPPSSHSKGKSKSKDNKPLTGLKNSKSNANGSDYAQHTSTNFPSSPPLGKVVPPVEIDPIKGLKNAIKAKQAAALAAEVAGLAGA